MTVELWQLERLVRQIVERPSRADGELRETGEIELERDRKAGALVTLSVASRDAVDGQHHHLDTSLFGPCHHLPVKVAIFVEIELIDLWRSADPARFL